MGLKCTWCTWCKRALGASHSETADSYHNLGTIQMETKDFQSALQSHQGALDIRLNLFGETHPRTADSYLLLAAAQHAQNDTTSACQSLQHALDIRETLFDQDDPQSKELTAILNLWSQNMN